MGKGNERFIVARHNPLMKVVLLEEGGGKQYSPVWECQLASVQELLP
jgi:hypothetical protein